MVSRYISNDTVFQNWGANLPWKTSRHLDKIEHEVIGAYARIEISQDVHNADQKVKCFLKVYKTYNFCGKYIFSYLFSKFLFTFTFYNFFDFYLPPPPPPPNFFSSQVIILANACKVGGRGI